MRRCASNLCQNLGDAIELTTHAQRFASALDVYRAHVLKHSTKSQHVASALNEWPAHEARIQRALIAQPGNGSVQKHHYFSTPTCAIELTTHAQRFASALDVYRAHVLKHSTKSQHVASALNEWPAHEARIQRALNAQPANGSVQKHHYFSTPTCAACSLNMR